jgi:hypothetical protein
MNDYSDDIDGGDIPEQNYNEEQEEQKTEDMVNEIVASAPPPIESEPETEKLTNDGKVKPETIEIQNKTKVMPYVISQPVRTKHFMFTNDADRQKLTEILENNGLTVEYSTVRDKPYITLKKASGTVGKIHFLYYNENTPEDKYVKIYLFDFIDPTLYSTVKNKLVNFFENFKPSKNLQGGARRKSSKKHRSIPRRTHKKKRVMHRKKTHKRK